MAEMRPIPTPRLASDAIDEKGFFDPRYTCDFDNSSPEIRWADPPSGCHTYALLVDDLDARQGIFCHWVIFNIPVNLRHLPAGIPPQESLPNHIRQGINSYGKLGYSGPCPPMHDSAHRYVIRLYYLTEMPPLAAKPTREEFLKAVSGSILSTVELMGRYRRVVQKAG